MRGYEKDFKEQAVKLANEIGNNKAAKQLGIPASTLIGWTKAKKNYNDNAFVGSGKQRTGSSNEREVELLKKIKELERANDILKEALGFFAKSRKK
jgi:transposase